MLSFLLSNWKAVVGALSAFLISYGVHSCDVKRIEQKHVKELFKQQDELSKKCDKEKAVTSEVSRDYQKDLYNLNKQLSDAKRMFNNKCVPVTKPTGGRDGTSSGGKFLEPNVINSNTFLEHAAAAEKVRLQAIRCQQFIRKERE